MIGTIDARIRSGGGVRVRRTLRRIQNVCRLRAIERIELGVASIQSGIRFDGCARFSWRLLVN